MNTLAGVAGHRRLAYWQVAGVDTARHLLSEATIHETDPQLRAPSEGEVVHVIARRLADHSELLGRLATSSRDFH